MADLEPLPGHGYSMPSNPPAHPAPATVEMREAISHEDACRLSRVFCNATGPRTWQDNRINKWLKGVICAALAPATEGRKE